MPIPFPHEKPLAIEDSSLGLLGLLAGAHLPRARMCATLVEPEADLHREPSARKPEPCLAARRPDIERFVEAGGKSADEKRYRFG